MVLDPKKLEAVADSVAKVAARVDAWAETKHPRAEDGKFGSGSSRPTVRHAPPPSMSERQTANQMSRDLRPSHEVERAYGRKMPK